MTAVLSLGSLPLGLRLGHDHRDDLASKAWINILSSVANILIQSASCEHAMVLQQDLLDTPGGPRVLFGIWAMYEK